jgi:hypothetical protein
MEENVLDKTQGYLSVVKYTFNFHNSQVSRVFFNVLSKFSFPSPGYTLFCSKCLLSDLFQSNVIK